MKKDAEKEQLPIPYYPSRRLLGLELEFDAAGAAFHEPVLPNGWLSKSDGSLNNGREFVLEPPLPVIEALPVVTAFSQETTKAKMHIGKKGGYHIHVQIHDYTIQDAARLAQLYWRFQDQINLLVGPSRRTTALNEYCMPLDASPMPTEAWLTTTFQLGDLTANRTLAKAARQKMVLNFAMMRCRRVTERTVEFRQPSPSKKVVNIYGWAVFAVGLVEFAKNERLAKKYINNTHPTWRSFLVMCRRIEKLYGARDLVNWVKWRHGYLNSPPDKDKIHKLYGLLVDHPHGLFHIARQLNINILAAKEMVHSEVQQGRLIEASPGKWRVRYDSVAKLDAEKIIRIWEARENPAQRVAAPSVQATSTPPPPPAAPILSQPVEPEPTPA